MSKLKKALILLGLLVAMPLTTSATVVKCTAYTGDEGGYITASGLGLQDGYIACDFLPFGTIVKINGRTYTVQDRIGENSTNHIDIYMENYDEAIQFGVQYIDVDIEE